jgi:hypothetical protein
VFAGVCRQAGITRADTVEEAFDAAAVFATTPLPAGPNVVVVTTVGGWGVLTADAITCSDLTLLELPADLLAALDDRLPARWSHNNPIDLAGSETRDTVTEVLDVVARHDAVHAVVFLGIGIQSNEARMMREGPYFPEHGLGRVVEFHERQDARYAQAAATISAVTGKPILVASELAVTDHDNAGPRAVREAEGYCVPSATRAVRALEHLWRHACHRRRTEAA